MADIDFINQSFRQEDGICAMASYSTIIEYYSDEELKIEQVIDKYISVFQLTYFSVGKNKRKNKHKVVFTHFHDYCRPLNKRGFDFIADLHNNNLLDTNQFCQIIANKAQLHSISEDDIAKIRTELIENEALAMILYKVDDSNFHAVTIGYDTEEQSYFYKDPEKPKIEKKDLLSEKDIWEYIIFNDYDK